MSRKKQFAPGNGVEGNSAAALFGKFGSDPLARRAFQFAALWPKTEREFCDALENYVKVVRTKAKYSKGRRKQFVEARIYPAIEEVLDILVPALCKRDSNPFILFAEAIEANDRSDFPANRKLHAACIVAARLTRDAPMLNEFGDLESEDSPHFNEFGELESDAALRMELAEPPLQAKLNVPVGFSDFMRCTQGYCEKRWKMPRDGWSNGTFYRDCIAFGFSFAKDPHKGGQPSSKSAGVLPIRRSKQK